MVVNIKINAVKNLTTRDYPIWSMQISRRVLSSLGSMYHPPGLYYLSLQKVRANGEGRKRRNLLLLKLAFLCAPRSPSVSLNYFTGSIPIRIFVISHQFFEYKVSCDLLSMNLITYASKVCLFRIYFVFSSFM